MDHLDLRSPLVVDTRELGRRPGASRRLSRTIPAPADLGTDIVRIPEGSDLHLQLLLESVMEGVLVSGTVRGSTHGECVRCLDDVVRDVEVPVQELFAYPGSSSADDEDLREMVGDHLDLEPSLRDTLVPTLPFKPVCRDDCPGLCSECGERLADAPDHTHEVLDVRWAALTGFTGERADRRPDQSNPLNTDRPDGPNTPRS